MTDEGLQARLWQAGSDLLATRTVAFTLSSQVRIAMVRRRLPTPQELRAQGMPAPARHRESRDSLGKYRGSRRGTAPPTATPTASWSPTTAWSPPWGDPTAAAVTIPSGAGIASPLRLLIGLAACAP